jgi:predicted nucleic acid-binding Zn ribbon protein
MSTVKPGQKRFQFVLDEDSEMLVTLLEWANQRGLSPGKATRVILADWSDAINGRPNPFAAAIAAAGQPMQTAVEAPAPEIRAEERTRQAALLQAAEQFM